MGQPGAARARIVDRGYQHYEGSRRGTAFIVLAMTRASMARGMGIRRPIASKIMPWLLLIGANTPVTVLLAFQLLNRGSDTNIPSFATLETQTNLFFYLLFAAVVGPDLFCADRREHVLALYFTAPITRTHYVLARTGALLLLLLALTLLPMLTLFAGDAMLASSAADFTRDNLDTLGRAVLAGLLLATFYAALASVVSSFSDRRVYAGGAFVGLLLITGLSGSTIGQGIEFGGHERFIVLDLLNVGTRTVRWVFGLQPLEPNKAAAAQAAFGISGWAYLSTMVLVIVVSLLLLVRRYQKMAS